MVTIYKITNPNNKIYIGQAANFKRRKAEYKRNKCKAQTSLYNSIKKYGFENHKFDIIEEVSKEIADEKEVYWINHYNSYNTAHGMNLTPGGKRPAPKKGKNHYKAKIIYQYDLCGNLINKWHCIKDVEKSLGYNSTIIGKCTKTTGYAYGSIWSFVEKSFSAYIPSKGKLKSILIKFN